MGCCASRKTAAVVGVEENVKQKSSNGHHATENTLQGNSVTDARTDSPHDQVNPNFTITPKYTVGVNGATPRHDRSPGVETKPSGVFPSATGYRNTNSRERVSADFLTPGRTNDILSTTYNNTDHLRASPYLSGINNRKQYDRTERDAERFRGFDAPDAQTDSEDGFDSDIEKEENVATASAQKPSSPEEVSLSSLMDENKNVPDQKTVEMRTDHEPAKEVTRQDTASERGELRKNLFGGENQSNLQKGIVIHSIETEVMSVPESTSRLGTPVMKAKTSSPRSQKRSPVTSRSGTPHPPPDPIMETLEDAFFHFARYGEVNSEGREMNNKNWAKLCRDCEFVDNKSILTGDVDVIFSRHKPKGHRLIDFDMFVKCLQEVADRKYKVVADDRARRRKVFDSVIGKAPEYVGITGVSRTGNVERMTDHSLYPVTHKSRFDEEGRGLGVEELLVFDPTEHGYVQGYREQNTYDLKVSRPTSRSSIRPVSREASNLSRSSPRPNRREAPRTG